MEDFQDCDKIEVPEEVLSKKDYPRYCSEAGYDYYQFVNEIHIYDQTSFTESIVELNKSRVLARSLSGFISMNNKIIYSLYADKFNKVNLIRYINKSDKSIVAADCNFDKGILYLIWSEPPGQFEITLSYEYQVL